MTAPVDDDLVLVLFRTGMWPGETKPIFVLIIDGIRLVENGDALWPAEQPSYLPVSNLPTVLVVTTQGDFDHRLQTYSPDDGAVVLVHKFQAESLLRMGKVREPTAKEVLDFIESLPSSKE